MLWFGARLTAADQHQFISFIFCTASTFIIKFFLLLELPGISVMSLPFAALAKDICRQHERQVLLHVDSHLPYAAGYLLCPCDDDDDDDDNDVTSDARCPECPVMMSLLSTGPCQHLWLMFE